MIKIKSQLKLKLWREEIDNSCDENYSIILAESDDEEEKEGTVEKDFHILEFDKEESELIKDLQFEFMMIWFFQRE